VHALRIKNKIIAAFKTVDTCAGEFDAESAYYYSSYDPGNEVNTKTKKKKILIIGSGPIRIGQGIEFDYCSVHCV
jgi:carbamoyl-phosphate synthase large subunit